MFSCCSALLIADKKQFSNVCILLKCKLKLTLNCISMKQTFPGISPYWCFSLFQIGMAFIIPLLCLFCGVLCHLSLSISLFFSQNIVMPEIFPSYSNVPVITPHSTCSGCHSVFFLMSVLLISSCIQTFHDSSFYYSVLVKHHGNT